MPTHSLTKRSSAGRLGAALLIASLTTCAQCDRPASNPDGRVTSSQTPGRGSGSSAQTPDLGPLDSALAARCETPAILLARMPDLQEHTPKRVSFSSAWGGADARAACRVAASGHSVNEYASVDTLLGWLRIAGWRENTIYSADGPDGTVVGMHNAGTTCIIEGRWDGGDDSDSTVVRSDTLDILATCTETIAADTASDRARPQTMARGAPVFTPFREFQDPVFDVTVTRKILSSRGYSRSTNALPPVSSGP